MPPPLSPPLDPDRELLLSRVFDAPRELVWKVWTDPAHIVQWWGPRGFRTTTRHFDLKPGGAWRFIMHGPDGHDYENQINFLEIIPNQKLAYRHGGDGGDGSLEDVNFAVTVTFEAVEGSSNQTRVTMRSTFVSKDSKDFVVGKYNAEEGGKQHLARLAEYLVEAARSSGTGANTHENASAPFVIRRVFNAPRELVWKAWTEREHLLNWFGPPSMTIPDASMDLRPGGFFHYLMRGDHGETMWGRWTFHEIVPPERLVFTLSFSDEHAGATRAPFDETWPMEMLAVVTFDEHAGIGKGTLVTITKSAYRAAPAEQRTFDAGHGSMQQGWSGTLDKLTAYLEGSR